MTKEWHHDALHDGRPVGARGRRRVCVGPAARGGMRGVRGGARGAVPARGAAQGAAGTTVGTGPLARGAGRRAGRAAPAPRALGYLESRRGGGALRTPRVPTVLDEAGGRGRARACEAAIGDARAAAAPLRSGRASDARAFMLSDHHGRIGVVVKTDASPETDKTGAKIEGVTPGGPADKAGLKVGDVITKFNGTSLAAVKAEDEDESGPGRKLVELARK